MTTYELLCKTHRALAQRGERAFSETDRQSIVERLLAAIAPPPPATPGLEEARTTLRKRPLYPWYYQPLAGEAKTFRLLTGEKPRARVLAANHYELEIIRLLALWGAARESVNAIVRRTLERLAATCFGRFCPKGECVGASVAALRLISVVQPRQDRWVRSLLTPLGERFVSGRPAGTGLPWFYFCLALADLPAELAVPIIRKRKELLRGLLYRGWLTGPAEQDRYNILRKYVLRNALARLPECQHLREARITVSSKDGRCYCEV